MVAALNRLLDGLVRPEVPILGAPRSALRVCGFAGLVAAAALAFGLAWIRAWPGAVVGLLLVTGGATFLTVAMLGKALRGTVQLVFYRHAVAVTAACAAVLAVRGEPVLAYLDLVVVGLGAFLTCGRVGCLMVGCCHGRPSRVGVRYRREHTLGGFSALLVGVRLFPSQAIEALAALGLTTAGAVTVAGGAAPGVALTEVAVGYALVRFVVELTRGDWSRPIVLGLSEAQWWSLAVIGGVVAAGRTGDLPAATWHVAAAVAIGFGVFFLWAWRYLSDTPRHLLLHPRHIHECAIALDRLATEPDQRLPRIVATTSLGVKLSLTAVPTRAGKVDHVAISHRDGPLPPEVARVVAELICQLHPTGGRPDVVRGPRGVFHLRLRH